MEKIIDENIQCCYNCSNCVAYFGARCGGTVCDAKKEVVKNMLRPRPECVHFSAGGYKTKRLNEASEYIQDLIKDLWEE